MIRLTSFLAVALLATGCPEKKDEPAPPATDPSPEPLAAEEVPAPEEEPEPAPTEEETAEREDQSDLDCDDAEVDCPLYDWQTEHSEPAVKARDNDAIAATLHQIEFYAPDASWNEGENGWAKIARRGAIAAKAGDFDEARKACRNCHREYPNEDMPFREMYRTQGYRTSELPEIPENAAETGIPDLKLDEG